MSGIIGGVGSKSGIIGITTQNLQYDSDGYKQIGGYRFKIGSGTLPAAESSFTNGAAGLLYYTTTGLSVSLTGFASVIGAVCTFQTAYVEVATTVETMTTSTVTFRVSSARGDESWASGSGYKMSYMICGTPS